MSVHNHDTYCTSLYIAVKATYAKNNCPRGCAKIFLFHVKLENISLYQNLFTNSVNKTAHPSHRPLYVLFIFFNSYMEICRYTSRWCTFQDRSSGSQMHINAQTPTSRLYFQTQTPVKAVPLNSYELSVFVCLSTARVWHQPIVKIQIQDINCRFFYFLEILARKQCWINVKEIESVQL